VICTNIGTKGCDDHGRVRAQELADIRHAQVHWTVTPANDPGAAFDLQQWIDRLSQAARSGEIVDLAGAGPVDPAQPESWAPGRCVPAAALRHVLTSAALTVDPRGLRIRGAYVCGEVDLAHVAFAYPLHLIRCAITAAIDFRGAALNLDPPTGDGD
jgi:hypothetical protein